MWDVLLQVLIASLKLRTSSGDNEAGHEESSLTLQIRLDSFQVAGKAIMQALPKQGPCCCTLKPSTITLELQLLCAPPQ